MEERRQPAGRKTLVEVLALARWTPTRSVDPEPYRRTVTADGYAWSHAATEAVSSLGGLTLRFPTGDGREDSILIDPALGAAGEWRDAIAELEQQIGTDLTPIGRALSGNATLYIDPGGAIYAYHDPELFRLGDSLQSVLDGIVTGSHLGRPIVATRTVG